jgi:hypothetical protein
MKKYIIILSLIFHYNGSNAQIKLARVDSVNIQNGRIIANNLITSNLDTSTYLLLNLSHRILLIHAVNSSYKVITGIDKNNYTELDEMKTRIVAKSRNLDRCFDEKICNPSYVYMATDSALMDNEVFDTEYIYFVLVKTGRKMCEFNTPVSYKSKSGKTIDIPLDPKVFKYLVKFLRGGGLL